ncbi:MAG: MotA/TolQ/ExbB proton channel family protein [Bdellovibrionales bacterium]|nr:MotA/TolQ/ExbB proton channel family protein [Bdellovibrionales bacterium]
MFNSIWLGAAAIVGVLYYGVFHGFNQGLGVFLNSHALILVFGGTAAVALFSYRISHLMELFDFFVYGFLLKRKVSLCDTAVDLLKGLHWYRNSASNEISYQAKHPFVFDALRVYSDPKIDTEDSAIVLESIQAGFHKRYLEQAKMILNLSKFPPALGLLGASTGMIQMMMNLKTNGTDGIGASMAIALTATFWGIGFANFILLPLSDFAFQAAEDDVFLREMVSEGVILAKEGKDLKIVAEAIANRLPIQDRFKALRAFSKIIETESAVITDIHDAVVPSAEVVALQASPGDSAADHVELIQDSDEEKRSA